jgi:hypothetical protein
LETAAWETKNAFDAAMARRGIQVPDDLWEGAFRVYVELGRMAALMHRPRPVESEPSNVFVIRSLVPEQYVVATREGEDV